MLKAHYKSLLFFTISLLLFGLFCSLKIGLNADEPYHHTNGALRYLYLTSLGDFKGYDWENTKWYPGLYDLIVYMLCKFFDNFIDLKYTAEIRHFINYTFSTFGILGLFLVNRKIFNKEIAILSCVISLLNPIFFGHLGNNPKDPIVFTSLIWTIYFFINYLETLESFRIKNLILMSICIGFGVGIRVTFIALLIPLFFIWVFIILKKKIKFSQIILDIFFSLILIISIAFVAWPQIHNGEFHLITEVIQRSSKWLIAFKHGLINGEFYEIRNTPRSYILKIFFYRVPLYFSLLIIFSFFIIINKKSFFISNFNSNFFTYFYLLIFLLFFPISTMIITKTNLYDNGRLILFTIPFFATIASFGLFYIFSKYKEFSITYNLLSISLFILIILSFYRFVMLTPYQYTYTNYLSTPKYIMGENKFEHDYVYTSYPELMKKIKRKYGKVETSKLKIRTCDNHFYGNKYNFRVFLGIKQTDAENAEYVIMTNRNLRYRKMNCFQLFQGKDIVSVKRLGLTLSTLRKISSKESKEYMTHDWRMKNESWYKKRIERGEKNPSGYNLK